MRKYVLFFVLFMGGQLAAQNVQLHYDFGKGRKFLTSTVEMFKPDKLGNTFFFIDMDYNSGGSQGVSMAYWELARVFKTKKMPFGIQAEFNSGFGQFNPDSMNLGYRINSAWLFGVDYSLNAKDYSKGVSFKALYKFIQDKQNASFQLTAVWYYHFLNRKLTFSGFADFWREDSDFNFDGTADAKFIFLAEPQLWLHLNPHFSVGGEVEFNNNFANQEGFHVNPTLGLKWTF